MAASKKMAEFVGQENAEKRRGKRNAREEEPRFDKRPEIIGKKTIESRRFIGGERGGELRPGGERGERGDHEQADSRYQGTG